MMKKIIAATLALTLSMSMGNFVYAADVYFTNSEKFDVWLKLRVLTADGTLLGETGLIRPGEYVKSVSLTSEVEDGTAIKLKIMAYEPDTYYSAGSVTLNTILREGGAE